MGLTLYNKFDRLMLEAEVPTQSLSDFERQYLARTGEKPAVCQIHNNRWGVECRIYFNAAPWIIESLQKLGYYIEDLVSMARYGSNRGYRYRINSRELFWRLIRHGYRLAN